MKRGRRGVTYELEEGAELIGVYGVLGQQNYITSLGMLTKILLPK